MLVAREVEKRNGWMSMFFHTSGVRAPTDFGGVLFVLKKGREMERGVLSSTTMSHVLPYVEKTR